MSEPEWLTIAQAAARLQTSPRTIYLAIERRHLKALRLGLRRSWRIHVDWLAAWCEAEAFVVEADIVNADGPGPDRPFPAIRPKPPGNGR